MKNIMYLLALGMLLTTLTSCHNADEIRRREASKQAELSFVKVKTPNQLGSIEKVTVAEFDQAIKANKGVLVDVRTAKEYAEGHLEGAVNVDFKKRTFPSYISAIPKDQPVLIYCRSGNRSGKASLIMQSLGFTSVIDLAKGFKGWNAENLPVVTTENDANKSLQETLTTNAPTSMAINTLGKGVNVDVVQFDKLIKEGKVTLVDVRTVKEFAEGHIAGAVNVDWKNRHFSDNILAISNEKPVAVYCRSGNRSSRAMHAMQAIGFNEVINLEKGFKSWKAAKMPVKTLEVKGDIRHLDVENFNNAIVGQVGTLVDVRTPSEFTAAHIPGAKNIDYKNSNFKTEFSKLDKEEPVLIYCRSGARSGRAMKILEGLGYKVYNLDDGFLDWKSNGMKIEGKNLNVKDSGEEGC